MDELIIRSLRGLTTDREEERLRGWREASPDNDRRYRQVEELWALLEVASPSASAGPPPSVDEILERAAAEEEQPFLTERAPVRPSAPVDPARVGRVGASVPGSATVIPLFRRRRLRRGVAAGLLAASFGLVGFGLGMWMDGADTPKDVFAGSEITTGAGELATVTLADGTAIRVGPHSTVRLAVEDGEPVAWLSGRAFFGVEPNPDREFTVRTEHGEVAALGTRFEVHSQQSDFEVLVVEGIVRVSAAGATVELSESLMSRSSDGGALSTSTVEDIHSLLDWMGTTLVFRATPLAQVVSEIEHRYGVDVIIDKPGLREVTVSAVFIDQTLEEVASVVCEIVGADCQLEDGWLRMAHAPERAPATPTLGGGR